MAKRKKFVKKTVLTKKMMQEFLYQVAACESGTEWFERQASFRSAWSKCKQSHWMTWLVAELVLHDICVRVKRVTGEELNGGFRSRKAECDLVRKTYPYEMMRDLILKRYNRMGRQGRLG